MKVATKTATAFERVQTARHPERPYTLDLLKTIFTDFIEVQSRFDGHALVEDGRRRCIGCRDGGGHGTRQGPRLAGEGHERRQPALEAEEPAEGSPRAPWR